MGNDFVSYRRTNTMRGCVNFPVSDPRFRSTGEGGMFVRLVVTNTDMDDPLRFLVCCGGGNDFTHDEVYQRDDNREPPPPLNIPDGLSPEEMLKRYEAHDRARREYVAYHFPNLENDDLPYTDASKYQSVDYLAVLTIGSTGWSGWDNEREEYWYCTYDDLTDEGKRLYESLKTLYPGSVLHLQTWLDT